MDEPVRVFLAVSRINGYSGTYQRTRQWRWDLVHAWLRSHQLLAFFLIAFIAAWMVWLPMITAARGQIGVRFPPFFLWIAGIAPIGAATLVEWIVSGKQGVRRLYSRFLVRGVPFKWYGVAAALPVCMGLMQILVTGGSISFGTLGLAILVLIKGTLYAPVAAFEEVGWRGFALPRLQNRLNALISSLVLA